MCELALKSDIPSITQYVHPTEKQCNYQYVHPTAKQCSWEPDLSSVPSEVETLTKVHSITGTAISKRSDEYGADAINEIPTFDLSSYFKIGRNCRVCVEHTEYTVSLSYPFIGQYGVSTAYSYDCRYSFIGSDASWSSGSGGKGTSGPNTVTNTVQKTYAYYDVKYFPYNEKYLIRNIFTRCGSNSRGSSVTFTVGDPEYTELNESDLIFHCGALCLYYGLNNPVATSDAEVTDGSITINVYRSS